MAFTCTKGIKTECDGCQACQPGVYCLCASCGGEIYENDARYVLVVKTGRGSVIATICEECVEDGREEPDGCYRD